MKWHLLLFVFISGASRVAWAQPSLVAPHVALEAFAPLIGDWQCQGQQMHIELDHFGLAYVQADVQLRIARLGASGNIKQTMRAMSAAQESLFKVSGLIAYDSQRGMFVQYEQTEGGADATLYSSGFNGACLTWQYARDADAVKQAPEQNISIEATYCLASEDAAMHIDYTLHLAGSDPFVLFTANCDRQPSSN